MSTDFFADLIKTQLISWINLNLYFRIIKDAVIVLILPIWKITSWSRRPSGEKRKSTNWTTTLLRSSDHLRPTLKKIRNQIHSELPIPDWPLPAVITYHPSARPPTKVRKYQIQVEKEDFSNEVLVDQALKLKNLQTLRTWMHMMRNWTEQKLWNKTKADREMLLVWERPSHSTITYQVN